MTEYTKGPWFLHQVNNKRFIGPCKNNGEPLNLYEVVVYFEDFGEFKDSANIKQLADANLVAASPELFLSLKNIMDGIETGMIEIDSVADEQLAYALRQAKAALAKANPQ